MNKNSDIEAILIFNKYFLFRDGGGEDNKEEEKL